MDLDPDAVLAGGAEPDPSLSTVHRLDGFEPLARDRMHPAAYDYVAGGVADERALTEAEAAWRTLRLQPRVLANVAATSLATTMAGLPVAMPVAIAPMAVHALAHPDAEIATARAAATAGVPFVLSTMASCSIEEVAAAAPDGTNLFQLYIQRDRAFTRELVERAVASGYRAILLTVDLPVLGYRERDRRSGFTLNVPLGNFRGRDPKVGITDGYRALEEGHRIGLTWSDVEEIRGWSSLPLFLKGIVTPADAVEAVAHGVDGIVVSTHGGRQLDALPAPADALPAVVDAVGGRIETWVDGGIRRGTDVAAALGLGARGVLLGRPILYALAVGGETAVGQALRIVHEELEIALAILGAASISDLAPAMVTRRPVEGRQDAGGSGSGER